MGTINIVTESSKQVAAVNSQLKMGKGKEGQSEGDEAGDRELEAGWADGTDGRGATRRSPFCLRLLFCCVLQ